MCLSRRRKQGLASCPRKRLSLETRICSYVLMILNFELDEFKYFRFIQFSNLLNVNFDIDQLNMTIHLCFKAQVNFTYSIVRYYFLHAPFVCITNLQSVPHSQWVTFFTNPCLFLLFFKANLQHSLILLAASSVLLHLDFLILPFSFCHF